MEFILRVKSMKDASGEEKRAMMTTLRTEIEGIGELHAVAELEEGTELQKEVDFMITSMMSQKQEKIKEKNKKKLGKK